MDNFGTLLSVNIGQAADLPLLQGETVLSGFVKQPSHIAEPVGMLGLTGDDHVDDVNDPDRAVLFYQRAHYDEWAQELHRDLPFGIFGEQLTVEGPPEEEVRIGDQLAVGDVLVQVTQPRIPCRRMAARFDLEDMPIRFMRSGRTGFFGKVLKSGSVREGDRVQLVRRGPEALTVADLAKVLHSDEPEPQALQRALACEAIPPLVRVKLTKLRERASARAAGWDGDRPLVVTQRTAHGTDVVAFELADPDGARLPEFQPGQFLTLVLDVPSAARPVVRTYTIAGRSTDGAGYRLAIKREQAPVGLLDVPPGVGSGHMHDAITVGAIVRARSPRGRFVLQSGTRPVVLISAGIGITPMVAMLEDLVARTGKPGADRDVYFVHSARSSQQRAFGPLVDELVATSPRLRSYLVYGRPDPADRLGIEFHAAGRLSAVQIADLLPSLDADFYICGPAGFMADIAAGLVELGAPQQQVHYEFFGPAISLFGDDPGDGDVGPEVVDENGRPITVTFARSGMTVPWRENVFSLLSLAETAGLRPDASCRTGLCGTCVCRLDDGEISYAIEPMDETKPGRVFLCCARPVTSVMVDL